MNKLSIFQLDAWGSRVLRTTFEYPRIGFSNSVFLFYPDSHCSFHDMIGCYHLNAGDIAELEKE